MNKIPCFIISYNRLTYLRSCIEALKKDDRLKLIVLDNNSTYPPLLEYFKDPIFDEENIILARSIYNFGYRILWESDEIKKTFRHYIDEGPYLVTDCDILPPWPNIEPTNKNDWLSKLLEGLEKYPEINKIGLGLRKHDIYDSKLRHEVNNHENSLFKEEVGDPEFIKMPVDTTLAIYRQGYFHWSIFGTDSPLFEPATKGCLSMRTKGPDYEAIHIPWYESEKYRQSEEHQFYLNSIKPGSTHWTERELK